MTAPPYLLLQASANAIPLADESVQCVVTSPPYWGLRQYAGEQRQVWGGDSACAHAWGAERYKTVAVAVADKREASHASARDAMMDGTPASTGAFCDCGAWYGALGLEPTPELYVAHMVEVFREVRRVLRADGTLWLNLGDSYAGARSAGGGTMAGFNDRYFGRESDGGKQTVMDGSKPARAAVDGLKAKDLVGIPWMVAFALRSDGWYLRSDIIWHKPNPMPESVTDRPTKAHEYLFLLSKSERYYYDATSICEPAEWARWGDQTVVKEHPGTAGWIANKPKDELQERTTRNKRTVWTIATRPYPGAHFATYPEDLVEPCIIAGSKPGDVVLDPFNGSGTTGAVAIRLRRSYVGLDISAEYLHEQAVARIDPLAGAQREARAAVASGGQAQGVFSI